MKTTLKVLSLVFAAGLPAAVFAQLMDTTLPAIVNPEHLFTAFVTTLTMLVGFSDYAGETRSANRDLRQHAASNLSVMVPAVTTCDRLAA